MLQMDDEPGLLSRVLSQVAKNEANILTIHQTIPVNGIALVTLSMEIDAKTGSTSTLMEEIESEDGIHFVKIVSRE
jgi:chorismate mutase